MTNRRVVLVGFMGCGKTSVAKALAHQLDCDFVDLDTFITKAHGRSPAEIIEEDGEPAFRLIETRALEEVLKRVEFRLIALGGGAWTTPANRKLVGAHDCLSVWLDAPFALCWQRISAAEYVNRPLAPDRETAQKLYQSRRADYCLAQLRIDANADKEVAEVIDEISRNASAN